MFGLFENNEDFDDICVDTKLDAEYKLTEAFGTYEESANELTDSTNRELKEYIEGYNEDIGNGDQVSDSRYDSDIEDIEKVYEDGLGDLQLKFENYMGVVMTTMYKTIAEACYDNDIPMDVDYINIDFEMDTNVLFAL